MSPRKGGGRSGRARGRRRKGGRRGSGGRGRLSAAALAVTVIGFGGLTGLGVFLAAGEPGEIEHLRDPVIWTGGRVRVEVYNGGGVTGMAAAATEVLRDSGFDVVTFGNALPFDSTRTSEVIDRVGRTEVARAVAGALGIDNVQSDPDPNLYVDVSVVLGREWVVPSDGAMADPGSDERRWWDPRQWMGG